MDIRCTGINKKPGAKAVILNLVAAVSPGYGVRRFHCRMRILFAH